VGLRNRHTFSKFLGLVNVHFMRELAHELEELVVEKHAA
jgi:hypothetical protein